MPDDTPGKDWHRFNNSVNTLYPPKQTWIIGGKPFIQRELGWIELLQSIDRVYETYTLSKLAGVIDPIEDVLANELTRDTFELVFYHMMDRREMAGMNKLFGWQRIPYICSLLRKPLPPLLFNPHLYAIILQTKQVAHLASFLDYKASLPIQSLFLRQNDIDGMLRILRQRKLEPEKDHTEEPTWGFYEQFSELAKHGIQVPPDWSLRKIENVYTTIQRKGMLDHMEDTRYQRMRDVAAGAKTDEDLRVAAWKFEQQIKVIKFGVEQKPVVEEELDLPPGDY